MFRNREFIFGKTVVNTVMYYLYRTPSSNYKTSYTDACKKWHNIASALDADEWLTSRPDRFTSGSEQHCPLNRKLGGPHRRSGRFGLKKNFMRITGFKIRTIQPAA